MLQVPLMLDFFFHLVPLFPSTFEPEVKISSIFMFLQGSFSNTSTDNMSDLQEKDNPENKTVYVSKSFLNWVLAQCMCVCVVLMAVLIGGFL